MIPPEAHYIRQEISITFPFLHFFLKTHFSHLLLLDRTTWILLLENLRGFRFLKPISLNLYDPLQTLFMNVKTLKGLNSLQGLDLA